MRRWLARAVPVPTWLLLLYVIALLTCTLALFSVAVSRS